MKFLLSICMIAVIAPSFAQAESLDSLLQKFDSDPQTFMNTIPPKAGPKTQVKFSQEAILNKDFITIKNQDRKLRGRAGILSNDQPSNLVDNGSNLVSSLEAMEKKNLTSSSLAKQPWSDHYWPLYLGQISLRYADPQFPESDNWKTNTDYVRSNKVEVNKLSPAEKYDLLVGDSRKSLTQKAMSEGEGYFRSNGSVEKWMGICHGWAPAAYMIARPENAVTVTAADGRTKITFYPADIKALSSLLWATNAGETNFIGGRCNEKNPQKDSNGRITDSECFDTNPGAWHTAIVNQIGVNKRSLVIDATYDYEVWNQPVQQYSYTYFNPQTLKAVSSLDKAKVAIKDFSKDKFKKYRSNKAAYVVGISMDMSYVAETIPSAKLKDSSNDDALNNVSYQYDLELDANGNIIGGEWYNNAHPDFLWTPTPNAKATTAGDRMLAKNGDDNIKWDGTNAIPRAWQAVAARTSESGSPLAVVVDSLVKLSNKR